LARLTRHELKQDELLTTVEEFENFTKKHRREIILVVVGVILVAGAVYGFRFWSERQESECNALLGTALKTFHASVGSASPDLFGGGQDQANPTFPTAQAKYKKAVEQFDNIVRRFPKLALAGELVRAGKLNDAAKLYRELQDHPTSAVPKATAMLALADAYRQSQPAQARKIYEQIEKEFGSNTYLAATVKQQIESLPR